MKTSVKSIMMGMALTGCLIFSASDATAQGRIHSQASASSNRNQSASVSSSNGTSAPTVINTQTPQVNRNDKIRESRLDESQNNGIDTPGSPFRKGDATTRTTSTQDGTNDNGGKPNGGGNSDKPGNSGGSSTTPRPNDSGPTTHPRPNDSGPSTPPPPDGGPSMPPPPDGGPGIPPPPGPGVPHPIPVEICPCLPLPPHYVNSIGFGPEYPYDYSIHPHYSEFSWNYEHNNWSRPMPPPARIDRPSFRGWFRPVIPSGWHSNIGAPIIDGILGIPFGTVADDALDYLYSSGYFIDGYANSIVYLRSVPLLKMTWDDVMLAFNAQGRLVNAEFVIRTTYCIGHSHSASCKCKDIHNRINNHFYNRAYRHLCKIFGTPIKNGSGSLSWYGGDDTGWITLLTYTNSGNYYIMLSIGN